MEIPRKVRGHANFRSRLRKEEVEQWLLNYARNANKPIPVVFAITMRKLNAPRQLISMRGRNRAASHRKRKIEVLYECRRRNRDSIPIFLADSLGRLRACSALKLRTVHLSAR